MENKQQETKYEEGMRLLYESTLENKSNRQKTINNLHNNEVESYSNRAMLDLIRFIKRK